MFHCLNKIHYIVLNGKINMHDELGRKWEVIKQWYALCGPKPLPQ